MITLIQYIRAIVIEATEDQMKLEFMRQKRLPLSKLLGSQDELHLFFDAEKILWTRLASQACHYRC